MQNHIYKKSLSAQKIPKSGKDNKRKEKREDLVVFGRFVEVQGRYVGQEMGSVEKGQTERETAKM